MVAVKENRCYTITEVDIPSFQKEGYDIIGDNGEIIAYGAGKTVAFEKYAKLMKQVESLQMHIDELEGEIKKLRRRNTKKEG